LQSRSVLLPLPEEEEAEAARAAARAASASSSSFSAVVDRQSEEKKTLQQPCLLPT